MPNILEILNNYKLYFSLIFVLYVFYRYIHFRGLRREYSFDIFFLFVLVQVICLKTYYLIVNYQNFPSLREILLNFNVTDDALFVSLVTTFIFSFFISRIFRFSIYHLTDGLFISTYFFLIFYIPNYQDIGSSLDILWLLALTVTLLLIKKRFITGFFTGVSVFLITTYSLIVPFNQNNLIFYVILNTMNALFIFRRFRYMENHLSSDFISSAKNKLIARREEILKEIKDTEIEPREFGDTDYMDEVMDESRVSEDLFRRRDLKQLLVRIEKALKKIDEGKYGYDEKTGEPIDKARLELFPEAEENVK